MTPLTGETAVDFVERIEADGRHADLDVIAAHFDVTKRVAKSICVASVRFNDRFSYRNWSEKHEKSHYGAKNWLKRKYALSDAETDKIIRAYSKGQPDALGQELGFEGLAQRRLTQAFYNGLVAQGYVTDSEVAG